MPWNYLTVCCAIRACMVARAWFHSLHNLFSTSVLCLSSATPTKHSDLVYFVVHVNRSKLRTNQHYALITCTLVDLFPSNVYFVFIDNVCSHVQMFKIIIVYTQLNFTLWHLLFIYPPTHTHTYTPPPYPTPPHTHTPQRGLHCLGDGLPLFSCHEPRLPECVHGCLSHSGPGYWPMEESLALHYEVGGMHQ